MSGDRNPDDWGAVHNRLNGLARHNALLRQQNERVLMLNGRMAANAGRERGHLHSLADAEFRVTSQWGEDGIIDWLVQYVPMASRTFVEFGVENYQEANTRFLLQNRNWRGLVMDGSGEHMAQVRREELYWRHDVVAAQAFITRDNINGLLAEHGFTGDIGLLSIDIDGNDYWILDAIQAASPRILVCEYNAVLGDLHAVTVPYRQDFDRLRAHCSGQYFGASIAAIRALAEAKGYTFVGTCTNGVNAFFVRDDVADSVTGRIAAKVAHPSRHRDSRSASGELTHVRGAARARLIADMPVVLVDRSPAETVTLGTLGELYGAEWRAGMEG